MKNTFIISCPIDTYSGYGARARDFVKAIIETDKYDVYILSSAPWKNPSAWSDKLEWVKKYLGQDTISIQVSTDYLDNKTFEKHCV